MTPPKSELQKHLDEQKFLHAVAYVKQAATGIKKLNTSELAHLNQMLRDTMTEPWRLSDAQVLIPSGRLHHFGVVSNPIHRAREIIGNAFDFAQNDKIIEGADYLYSQLVLDHLFTDANRRTAVLATYWLLLSVGAEVSPTELIEFSIGDLRDQKDRKALTQKISTLTKLP